MEFSPKNSKLVASKSKEKKSIKNSNSEFAPVKNNPAVRLSNEQSPIFSRQTRRSSSPTETSQLEPILSSRVDSNANFRRSNSMRNKKDDKNVRKNSNRRSGEKLKRKRAVRKFLFVRQRRELNLETLLRYSRKKFYSLSILIILKLTLAAAFVYFILIDFRNSYYRVADVSKIRQTNFDVGAYPMSGVLLLASSSCLDAASICIFACGFLCECGYFRYYTRFVFVDFLMTFTAVCTLFISERKAVAFLKEFFKIILEYEYGDADAKLGTDFVDRVQESAKCCGYAKPNDWTRSKWWSRQQSQSSSSLAFPPSCCENRSIIDPICFESGCESFIFSTAAYGRIICQYLAILKTVILLACMLLCAAMYRDFVTSAPVLTRNTSLRASRQQNGQFVQQRRRHNFDGNICSTTHLMEENLGGFEFYDADMDPNLFVMERQLFQIEEVPSENQPSTTANDEVDVDDVDMTRYGSVTGKS